MSNEDYNAGWSDCLKHQAETHISLDEFSQHLDKFFDKINNLKIIIKWFTNHINNLDIQGLPIKDEETKKLNLEFIIKSVENLKLSERKKSNAKRNTKKE